MPSEIYDEAVRVLLNTYKRIMKVDLNSETYELVIDSAEEQDTGLSDSYTDWINRLFREGRIHADDVDTYRNSTAISLLRTKFQEQKVANHRVRYRRKNTAGEYEWVLFEAMPAEDSTEAEPKVLVYVQEINDAYIRELEAQRSLEHFCNYDSLTDLLNYYSYNSLCDNVRKAARPHNIGVIFCDLNGLKIINDTRGHQIGNEYIMSFVTEIKRLNPDLQIFRISGDEFVVIMFDSTEDKLVTRGEMVWDCMQDNRVPMAAIGYAWKAATRDIEEVVQIAERNMYEDKQEFYKNHPEFIRSAVNEQYRTETMDIIGCLAQNWLVLGTLNLEEDSYKILKTFENAETMINMDTFSGFAKKFTEERIKQEYRLLLEPFNDPKILQQILAEENYAVVEYEMTDGTWYRMTYRRLNERERLPEHAIFYVERKKALG